MENRNDDSYGHILKSIGLFGGVQGLGILINLVRNKMVAVLLGPMGMGLVALFNSAVNFVSQATNLGLPFSAIRDLSEKFDSGDGNVIRHYVKVIRCWGVTTALWGMLLFALLGPLLSNTVFSWGDHTLHFIFLSPVVGMMAITGCETAILKSTRQLRSLATIQIWAIVAALVVSVPIYWFFGISGIVPVLVLCAFSTMSLTLNKSLRLYPMDFHGVKRRLLGEGGGMVKLGFSYTLAGIIGSGAEMIIRSCLNVCGDLDAVGLYNAGYMLTVTYAGMVFSSMETDYFPRLSAVNHDNAAVRQLVNRQIEVSLLFIVPMLVALIIFLPIIIPLLFSGKFIAVVPMAQVAVFAMFFKVVTLPVSYVTLAKGDSRAYFFLECVYDVCIVVLVIYGYKWFGLLGTGIALSLAHLIELIIVLSYAYIRYGYSPSASVLGYMAMSYPLGALANATTFFTSPCYYWVVGLLLVAVSVSSSLYVVCKKTSIRDALKRKLLRI